MKKKENKKIKLATKRKITVYKIKKMQVFIKIKIPQLNKVYIVLQN